MSEIIGQKITNIRPMTKKEYEELYWDEGYGEPVMVLELENGVKLFPSRDYEGNGGGAVFGSKGKEHFTVFVKE